MDLRHSILLLLVGATIVFAQNKTTMAAPPPTTTAAPPPTTKAAPPTTTAAPPTTTAAPPTTTAAPPTTTAAPPTTTAAPPTTTAAPPTTTTALPSTTAAMSTAPPPITFVVNGSEGNACIMEQMVAQFVINYNKTDNTTAQIMFPLPQMSTVIVAESMCSSNTTNATIALAFGAAAEGNKFVQVFNTVGNNTYLQSISLSLNHTNVTFPNSTQLGKVVVYSGMLSQAQTFMVQNGFAFACDSEESFVVAADANVTFSNVKVQTSGIVNDSFSDEVKRCSLDTSTTPMGTTTPMVTTPTPPPPTPKAEWMVNNTKGNPCMLVNVTMNFMIGYKMTGEKNGTANGTANFMLPSNASSSSSTCVGNSANFILTFFKGWRLEMDFMKYSDGNYNNTRMSLFYIYDNASFPNTINPGGNATAVTNETDIKAALGSYFSCVTGKTITQNNVTFNMTNVAIQPFAGNVTDHMFGKQSECPADQKFNNIVPIAVGCALAGLVIIVLIAYLIGRQRSSKSGYESV